MRCAFSLVLVAAWWIPAATLAQESARDGMDPISRMFLMPDREILPLDPSLAAAVRSVEFENPSHVTLRGWLFDAKGTNRTVLLCMGNTGNQSYMQPYAKLLFEGGFDVLLFDYQGFGRSDGVASVLSPPGDALAAWTWLVGPGSRAPEDVSLLGISLGSVLALSVAAQKQPRAIAVEDVFIPADSFREATKMMGDSVVARMLASTIEKTILPGVDPIANVKRFRGPVLLLHGENDWLLPPWGTVQVAMACPSPPRTWMLADTGHAPESLEANDREYAHQIVSFFREAFDTGKVDEPSVTMRVEPRDGSAFAVKVSIESRARRPVQIALVDDQSHYQFERRWVDPGRADLEISTPFRPLHVSAIAFRFVVDDGGGKWSVDLSPLSRSLHDWRKFREDLFALDAWSRYETVDGRMKATYRCLSSGHWKWAREHLPKIADVHVRVRPRYARLVAKLAVDLDRIGRHEAFEAAALAQDWFPEDPSRYYELGNASFEIGFHGIDLANATMLLVRRRVDEGRMEDARRLLDQYVALRPTHAYFSAGPESVEVQPAEANK